LRIGRRFDNLFLQEIHLDLDVRKPLGQEKRKLPHARLFDLVIEQNRFFDRAGRHLDVGNRPHGNLRRSRGEHDRRAVAGCPKAERRLGERSLLGGEPLQGLERQVFGIFKVLEPHVRIGIGQNRQLAFQPLGAEHFEHRGRDAPLAAGVGRRHSLGCRHGRGDSPEQRQRERFRLTRRKEDGQLAPLGFVGNRPLQINRADPVELEPRRQKQLNPKERRSLRANLNRGIERRVALRHAECRPDLRRGGHRDRRRRESQARRHPHKPKDLIGLNP
jgi:hypothetical protein